MKKVSKSTPVYNTDLSVRAKNILYNNGDLFGVECSREPEILTVSHLATGSKRHLRFRRGAGPKTLKEIEDLCTRAGLKMRD